MQKNTKQVEKEHKPILKKSNLASMDINPIYLLDHNYFKILNHRIKRLKIFDIGQN